MDKTTNGQPASAQPSDVSAEGCRWARFLAGLLLVLLFAFGAIPGLQQLGPVSEVRDVIRNSGIDATALFYTECEESFEAEASIRNAMQYQAHGSGLSMPSTSRTRPGGGGVR